MTNRKRQPKKGSRFVDKTGKEPRISVDGHKPPRMWEGGTEADGEMSDSPKSQ